MVDLSDLIAPSSPSVPPQSAAPAFLTPPTNLVPLPSLSSQPHPGQLPSLPPSAGSPGYGWSPAETDLLVALCKHVPTPSWDQIAAKLPGRTADACARRHRRISNREIVPEPASPIITPASIFDAKMAEVAPLCLGSPSAGRGPGAGRALIGGSRTGAVGGGGEMDRKRKRSVSTSAGIVAKTEWTAEENALLLSMVECDAPKTWGEVKEALPGRSEGACRGRYGRILKEREVDAASKSK